MDNHFVYFAAQAAGLACASGYLLTWCARYVASRLGLFDRPDGGRKLHSRPTPLLGGVAVYFAYLLVILAMGKQMPGAERDPFLMLRLSISGGLFCLLGVLDDAWALRPRTKLLGQIAASLPFVVGMHAVESVEFLGINLRLGLFGPMFMVFWLVACTNIVNLIDGLDGLASTIGIMAMVTIAGLSLLSGNSVVAVIALVCAGSIAGFLVHNWPPARIFLGDAGSLTIGFLAGALSLEASLKTAAVFTLTAPAVVMSVPAFDTFMAMLRRRLTGRRIGEADRGHIHHQLQDRGLSKLQTLLAVGALSLVMAASAILATYLDNDLIAAASCVTVFAAVVSCRVFGYHETLLVFWHVKALQELLLESWGLVGTRFLLARAEGGDASQRRQIWDDVCRWLERKGFTDLEVAGQRRDGEAEDVYRRWESAACERPSTCHWSLSYSIVRDDSWVFHVSGRGSSAPEERLPRTDDLFRLFHCIACHIHSEVVDSVPHVIRLDSVTTSRPDHALPSALPASDGERPARAA